MALEAIRKGWCVSSAQFNRTRKAFICFRVYWQPRNPALILAAWLLIFDRLRLNWSWHEATRSHALHDPYNLASPFLGNGTDISAYIQAAFNLDCPLRRSNHPNAMRSDTAHAHRSFEDARVHTAVAFTQDSTHACPFSTDQSALQGQTSSVTKHNG